MPKESITERYAQRMKNQPTEVVFCKNCVISNQRPRITFDENGVCSACNYAQKKANTISWEQRQDEFSSFLAQYRSKNADYDVIVPCSGGKDSSTVAHKLKYEHGMHPLTVTFSPLLYTEYGLGNLRRFVDSGFDNILFTPNGQTYQRLCRLGFEVMGDPFQPFIYGVKSFPLHIAVNHSIPLVMYGENGEVEYGGDGKNEDSLIHDTGDDLTAHYFSDINAEDWSEYGISAEDLKPFMPPDQRELDALGVSCAFFGYGSKWVPQENYYYAAEHSGFQAKPDGRSEGTYSKCASLDDRIDGIHFYLGFIKFGIGRATSDAAHEIRDGHITREEGVALVKRYDDEIPKKYFEDFLEYTSLNEDRFNRVVDNFRLPHLWEKSDGRWRLKYQVE